MQIKIAEGLIKWFLIKYKFAAITLPPFGIFVLKDRLNDVKLLEHEQIHWNQYDRMGFIKFYVLYLYYNLKYGYWNNPMEKEARKET